MAAWINGFDISPLHLLFWHRVARFSLFLGLLTLISCGQSKQPARQAAEPAAVKQAPPASQAPAKPLDTRPIIAAFGDSLTAGYGVDTGLSYPDFLQKDLDHSGYRYHVVNAGISGDTTAGGLARVDTVTQLAPKIVILELGGNDGLRGLPLPSTRENLDQIVQALRKSGPKIVLAGITLPPNYGPDYIREFEGIYKELAARYKLPFLPFLFEGVAGVPGMMQSDGIHATAKGNEVVATLVMRTLKPLLSAKPGAGL
jgi:acyl-CoA thioesterase-1